MLTRGALQQGQNFGITAGRGGGGGYKLVFPNQRGVSEVVPGGRTFQSLMNISFPKIVGEPGEGINFRKFIKISPTTITFQSETLKYFENLRVCPTPNGIVQIYPMR
jgi:hypothetical protein